MATALTNHWAGTEVATVMLRSAFTGRGGTTDKELMLRKHVDSIEHMRAVKHIYEHVPKAKLQFRAVLTEHFA